MKKLFSVLLVLSLVLTGCSSSNSGDGDNTEEVVLNLYLPGSYIDEELLNQFYDETGIRVIENNFDSNESMLIQLEAGNVYDVIIPSDYMIEYLIEHEMVQKLDKSVITNLDQLYEGVKNASYDPSNEYTVPYFWGNVGICFDTSKIDRADVERQGWDIFHDTKYKGLIYFYDSPRDQFMVAQKALGYSMNTRDKEELANAAAWLQQVQDTMEPLTAGDETIDGLAYPEDNDKKYLGLMYNGDAAYIISENENAGYIIPKQGTNFFIDAMCIGADSNHLKEACEFINFMISYEVQMDNSSYIGYNSVNAQALNDLMNGEFADNEAYLSIQRTTLDDSFHYQDQAHREYIDDSWAHIKISNK